MRKLLSGAHARLTLTRLSNAFRREVAPAAVKTAKTGSYKASPYQAMLCSIGDPVWMVRDYSKLADEGFARNVIAHRAITMIAEGAASVPWQLYRKEPDGQRVLIKSHPLLSLLSQPNPSMSGTAFFAAIYAYRLISGNSFIHAVGQAASGNTEAERPRELYALRPDRVTVLPGAGGLPAGYRYSIGTQVRDMMVDRLTGQSSVLHLKYFHPLSDWYGLSPLEAAAYSIDQHNQAGKWNQALLQNGARPSGALVVKAEEGGGYLSEEQFQRIKSQFEEGYSGSGNAGRPLLLEGGLEWREMSLSPKDMDFLDAKHSSARDIALAFGVPPQLLGIPGDNTYSNLQEARLALWEETILPMLDMMVSALNHWLVPRFGEPLELSYDLGSISALSIRRDMLFSRLEKASFMTVDEKRAMAGL